MSAAKKPKVTSKQIDALFNKILSRPYEKYPNQKLAAEIKQTAMQAARLQLKSDDLMKEALSRGFEMTVVGHEITIRIPPRKRGKR